ncbi:MAG: 16S rRNA (guanine(527)-N(7))-methyltransferase RsmG [Chloroflexota bacterium]
MDLIKFWTDCSANNIVLDKDQLDMVERFYNEFLHWNEKVNLISRKDEQHLLERHILHSMTPAKYLDIKEKARCLDVGTGGGFPGIPLKIALPTIHMLLCDSIGKKIKITDMLAKHTGLRNIEAINARVEELPSISPSYVSAFDYIFSRAVAKIAVVVALSKKSLKPGGKIVFLKGGDLTAEKEEATTMFKNLKIEEIKIEMLGYDWFTRDKKKIVVCEFE